MSGQIDITKLNTPPEPHELDTALYFAKLGYDIAFIKPSNIPNIHTPDISMNGIEWEIKCPQGKSRHTIEQNFRIAVTQSHNLIFDLRRSNIPEIQSLQQLQKLFEAKKYVKRLLIIKKSGELLSLFR